MKTYNVIAKTYILANGHELHELCALDNGLYIVTVNGQVSDARHKLARQDAREWYDRAAYQIGDRP